MAQKFKRKEKKSEILKVRCTPTTYNRFYKNWGSNKTTFRTVDAFLDALLDKWEGKRTIVV